MGEDKMMMRKDNMPMEKDKMVMGKDSMPTEKDKMTMGKDNMLMEKEKMKMGKDKMPMHNMTMPDLKSWPEASQMAVKEITDKYGAADVMGEEVFMWMNKGPWEIICIN